MKLNHISNIEGFFEMIDSCEGRVELISEEGDRINLKSKLTQYFSLANIFSDGVIDELEIVASDPKDLKRIIDFTLQE